MEGDLSCFPARKTEEGHSPWRPPGVRSSTRKSSWHFLLDRSMAVRILLTRRRTERFFLVLPFLGLLEELLVQERLFGGGGRSAGLNLFHLPGIGFPHPLIELFGLLFQFRVVGFLGN